MIRSGLFDRLDDALNPIVVKELRQAVQSKFVVAVLLLFLILQLGVLGVFLITQGMLSSGGTNFDFQAGREAFMILQAILLATCMLFLPAYTGLRMGAERSDVNVDLLFITTIQPRSIVSGKVLAAIILALVIFSACTPFMTFTYLLRGLDLFSIAFVVLIDFAAVLLSVQLAVLVAAIPGNRILKAVLGLALLTGLVFIYAGTVSATVELVRVGLASFETWTFWGPVGCCAGIALMVSGLLYVWSTALISAPTTNRIMPIRIYMLIVWVLTAVIFGCVDWILGDRVAPVIWLFVMLGMYAVGFLTAISEWEQYPARVARRIPRRWWLRFPAFFFFGGAAGGVLFTAGIIGLTFLAAFAWDKFMIGRGSSALRPAVREFEVFFDAAGLLAIYLFCYGMTAIPVRRLLGMRVQHQHTWIVALLLLAFGCAVPFLIAFFVMFGRWNYNQDYYWLLGNPFVAAADHPHGDSFLLFSLVWAGAALAVNLLWMLRQCRAFRPVDRGHVVVLTDEPFRAAAEKPGDATQTRGDAPHTSPIGLKDA